MGFSIGRPGRISYTCSTAHPAQFQTLFQSLPWCEIWNWQVFFHCAHQKILEFLQLCGIYLRNNHITNRHCDCSAFWNWESTLVSEGVTGFYATPTSQCDMYSRKISSARGYLVVMPPETPPSTAAVPARYTGSDPTLVASSSFIRGRGKSRHWQVHGRERESIVLIIWTGGECSGFCTGDNAVVQVVLLGFVKAKCAKDMGAHWGFHISQDVMGVDNDLALELIEQEQRTSHCRQWWVWRRW